MTTARHTVRRDIGGFSAIELMTVLVVIAVGVSLAVPSLSAYVERTRTRGALDRVVADVSFARLYAVQNGRRTAVNLQSDGTYTIDTISTGGSWAPIRTVSLGAGSVDVAIGGAVSTIEFSSRGILVAQASEAVVKIARGEHEDSIFVSPAGRIYRDY